MTTLNKKITELTELLLPDALDVMPIADISESTTKKILVSYFSISTHNHNSTYYKLDGSIPASKIVIDDALTYIDKDGSGNMTFTDALIGTRTLKQLGCPTMIKLVATGQSAGSLNLTYASWGVSKAWLKRLTVTLSSGTSTDFDVAIYEKDTFLAADRIYNLEGSSASFDIILDCVYEDQDATDEVHIKITDNDSTGSPIFSIEVRGVELI